MGLTAIVLGAAAGGRFPQWNCNCDVCRLAWAGDPRVRTRTQASLAVSADGNRWTLLNASPDLRAQIQTTQVLQPKGLRGSPIEAVVLTGGEIDQTAGLLSLRERSPFMLMATAATLAAVADNPMFGALASDVVSRRAITPGEKFALGGGLQPSFSWSPENYRSISKAKIQTPQRKARPMSKSKFPMAISAWPTFPALPK